MSNKALSCPHLERKTSIDSLFSMLSRHESIANGRLNLIASENVLSPLAKLPFLLDAHSRYFLNEFRRFGTWYFPSGEQVAEFEEEILNPLLSEMAGATYVNVRPISGMNCMMVALAALVSPGDIIFTIPVANGGHVSTEMIAKKFSVKIQSIPFLNAFDIDYVSLKKMIAKTRPALVYIDQATMLFPIDPQPIRNILDTISPETILHYDSSHTNGLILGKALFNPLKRGAHCYGGSTHKTLPGPHKGFLATNILDIATRLQDQAYHFISHHHTSSTLSLAITLMEMKWCGGDDYANQVILNTRVFAKALEKNGFIVAGGDRGYTECHQTWFHLPQGYNSKHFYHLLSQSGIMTSQFDSLPGIPQPAFRLSFAELTRMGGTTEDATLLADIMFNILKEQDLLPETKKQVTFLRKKLSRPQFCFTLEEVNERAVSKEMRVLCEALATYAVG